MSVGGRDDVVVTPGVREGMMGKVVTVAIAAVLMIGSAGIAEAECKHPRVPWQYGQSMSSTWRTDSNSVCTSKSNYPEHIAKIEIVSKPQHGIAGKAGPFGVAYKPQPGFHGSDSFDYEVTSNATYHKGAGLVAHVTVFVIVE